MLFFFVIFGETKPCDLKYLVFLLVFHSLDECDSIVKSKYFQEGEFSSGLWLFFDTMEDNDCNDSILYEFTNHKSALVRSFTIDELRSRNIILFMKALCNHTNDTILKRDNEYYNVYIQIPLIDKEIRYVKRLVDGGKIGLSAEDTNFIDELERKRKERLARFNRRLK